MEDVVGSDLETIQMVGLEGRKAHLVTGVYMPTSQRSFSMPVYYRLKDDDHHVTMTKLSITQIDRHSYGWTIQDADMEILAKAVYSKEDLVSEEPFGLPHEMKKPCWKLLSTVGIYKMKPDAHFEACPSPFVLLAQMQEQQALATSHSPHSDLLAVPNTRKTLMGVTGGRIPDSDDDTDSDDDNNGGDGDIGEEKDNVDQENAEEREVEGLGMPFLGDGDGKIWEGEERRSEAIAEKWTLRLGQLPATQGTISSEVDAAGEVTLKVRPAWPDWLRDVSFDVIKINRFGKRQKRQLRLTKQHILNIKDGKEVSRLHPYSQISRVYLTKPTKFILEFNEEENGRRLEYKSNDASQIVLQISTRIKIRAALQEVSPEALINSHTSTWRDSSSNKRKQTVVIISSEKHDRDSNVIEFTKSLGLIAKNLCESLSICVIPSSLVKKEQDAALARAISMLSGSKEFLVKRAVEDILLSKSSPAGSTRLKFINNFQLNDADTRGGEGSTNLLSLRHFIDGMHGYLLEHYVRQLATILLRGDVKQQLQRPPPSSEYGDGLREDDLIIISYIVFTVVEAALFTPLHNAIGAQYFADSTKMAQETDLRRRIQVLSCRQQHEWDISPQHVSPAGWSSAIFELAGIERNPTPSMRLQALVHAAKAIYSEFKCEVLPILRAQKGDSLSSTDAMLGADDFLPIFIFVVCQAHLLHPLWNKDLLWRLCHPDQLRGESGYYLTMYESAIEFIDTVEVSPEALSQVVDVEQDSVFNFAVM